MRTFWLRHIPDIERPSQEPEEALEEHEELRREIAFVPGSGIHRFPADVSPASMLFRESVFVLCKAVRISCESARQAAMGLPTWSISTAHHSNMFAVRALLGFCGIGYFELDGKYFLVDVHPTERKGQRQRRAVPSVEDDEVQLMRVSQMGHREWWMVYRRILRSSSTGFNWRPMDKEIALCDIGKLSKHRNDLHYRLRWFYDDLLEEKRMPAFGEFSEEAAEDVVERLDDDAGSDGMLILNQVLLGNTLIMLENLSRDSKRVGSVVATIRAAMRRFMDPAVWSCPVLVDR